MKKFEREKRDAEIWKAFISNLDAEHHYSMLAARFGLGDGTVVRTSLLRHATAERVKALGAVDALRVLKILARRGCARKEKAK